MAEEFTSKDCFKSLSSKRNQERHYQFMHMPWFVKNYLCKYCEVGFDSQEDSEKHLQSPEYTKMIAEGKRIKRRPERREAFAKRQGYTPSTHSDNCCEFGATSGYTWYNYSFNSGEDIYPSP